MTRYVHFASRPTGWNAIRSRAEQLGLKMIDAQYKECTAALKNLADIKVLGKSPLVSESIQAVTDWIYSC
jgi:hypothetical protein